LIIRLGFTFLGHPVHLSVLSTRRGFSVEVFGHIYRRHQTTTLCHIVRWCTKLLRLSVRCHNALSRYGMNCLYRIQWPMSLRV